MNTFKIIYLVVVIVYTVWWILANVVRKDNTVEINQVLYLALFWAIAGVVFFG
jgi:hypothetical protein